MNKKLVKAIDLKPGMIFFNRGYLDIILTVAYDGFIRLNLLGFDSTIRNWTYTPNSKITIYDPS